MFKKIFDNKIFERVILAIFPVILIFTIQFLFCQDFINTIKWMAFHFNCFLITYVFILLTMVSITTITNSIFVGGVVPSVIGFLLSLVAYLKYVIRGDYFVLGDIKMAGNVGQATSISPKYFLNFPFILGVILLVVLFVFLWKKRKLYRFNWIKRLIICAVCIFIIGISFFTQTSRAVLFEKIGIEFGERFRPKIDFSEKGLLLGLYVNYYGTWVSQFSQYSSSYLKPEGYSKEKIFEILDKVEENKTNKNEEVLEEETPREVIKPNVILIMSEAFSDVTKLKNVKFSQEPMPNLKKLMANYTSGEFISNIFGGGTGNVEYEVFTGTLLKLLNYGVTPYNDMIEMFERKIPTIQKDFKANGYKTLALHTYTGSFYNRTEIYPEIGFDKALFLEDMKDDYKDGAYVSDQYFVDQIIKNFESSEEPMFIWGLSMQNHFPYSLKNYNHKGDTTVSSSKLSDTAKDELGAYVHGISDTDKALGNLISHLDKSDKPTVVIFYGDHLPAIRDTYMETGFIHTLDADEWTLKERRQAYATPLLIYDNFGLKEKYENIGPVGASSLGAYILDYIDLPVKSPFFDFINSTKFKALSDKLFIDSNNKLYNEPTKKYDETIKDYELLQYDILFGKQYINEYVKK